MAIRPPARRKLVAEINVVPYIDVMLVLLIVFMITAPMMMQGVKVNLPDANSKIMEPPEEPLIISITKEGEYFINIGPKDASHSIEGILELTQKVIAEAPERPLLVRGDGDIKYQKVVQLMSALEQSGAPSVGLVTEPGANN